MKIRGCGPFVAGFPPRHSTFSYLRRQLLYPTELLARLTSLRAPLFVGQEAFAVESDRGRFLSLRGTAGAVIFPATEGGLNRERMTAWRSHASGRKKRIRRAERPGSQSVTGGGASYMV